MRKKIIIGLLVFFILITGLIMKGLITGNKDSYEGGVTQTGAETTVNPSGDAKDEVKTSTSVAPASNSTSVKSPDVVTLHSQKRVQVQPQHQ